MSSRDFCGCDASAAYSVRYLMRGTQIRRSCHASSVANV
jgi:hypothetical protein